MAQFSVKKETKFYVFDYDKYENVATFDNEGEAIKYKDVLESATKNAYEKGKRDGKAEAFKETNELAISK